MTRGQTSRVWSIFVLSAWLALASGRVEAQSRVYFGTYTGSGSDGIYVADVIPATGELTKLRLAGATANPSFLAMHPTQRALYAVGELGSDDTTGGPRITAFAIDPQSGLLKAMSSLPTGGSGPCHVSLDPAARFLAVANYNSGSIATYTLQPNGDLLAQVGFEQHAGQGPNPERQSGPHAHSVRFSAQGRLYTADLGLDQVISYELSDAGELRHHGSARVAAGGGPRHLTFTPDGRFLLVNNELASTVTSFAHDPISGRLQAVDTETTLPHDFVGENTTAELLINAQGDTVYCSNRGHDSIAVLKFDPQTGLLSRGGHIPTLGNTPRNFNLSRDGRLLVVANQDSDEVRTFLISPQGVVTTGATGKTPMAIPKPVCVVFAY